MIQMRCMELKSWVAKYHKLPFSHTAVYCTEEDDGSLVVYGKDDNRMSGCRDKNPKICEIPGHLMVVKVPYLSGKNTHLGGGTYIADMMELQVIVNNLQEELDAALDVVNDFLRS